MDVRRARALIISTIREHFGAQGFIETDTPSLVLSPGMEPHIRPIAVEHPSSGVRVFLPTSPEFAMKCLLAEGYDRIFQLCKAYRLEPLSSTHNPEFTMLEWYRGHSGYEAIMDDVEALFGAIARALANAGFASPVGAAVKLPWPRLTVEECFRKFAGLELSRLLETEPLLEACVERGWLSRSAPRPHWDDLFFLVMMNAVEPALARLGSPVIVSLYPESQAALSNLVTDSRGLRWAKRFEVYAGGFELGNAFDELTDADAQRRRFVKDMELRRALYGDEFQPNPIDEEFLKAVSRMPPSGGIAMGVDRIVMYFTGAERIADVLWRPSHWPAVD